MDVQGRRNTRALSNVNENLVKRHAAGKDAQLTRRPALKDQRNVAQSQEKVAVVHPDIVGMEREYQYVEHSDQVYKYLLHLEKRSQIEENFMTHSPSTPKMRSILVDWLIQVHTRFHLLPETLHLTVYLLDVMLSRTKVDKEELQLVGVACMLVASKYEEMYAPDIHDFEYITDNTYTKKQILKMETKILIAAKLVSDHPCFLSCLLKRKGILYRFELSRPHSIAFLRWYSKEMKFGLRMHHMCKFLIEMAFLDCSLSPILPSRIACVCTFIASKLKLTGITAEETEALVATFARVFLRLYTLPKLVAVREKYSAAKVLAVSRLYDSDVKILTELSS
uniref:Cyclin N-terminal domain-containing protein n=1 Tax=Angiostrongylus cantonensis TaxID=6313 RepID=A0A158P941_ANGCA